jgi:hypothetical protein
MLHLPKHRFGHIWYVFDEHTQSESWDLFFGPTEVGVCVDLDDVYNSGVGVKIMINNPRDIKVTRLTQAETTDLEEDDGMEENNNWPNFGFVIKLTYASLIEIVNK